MRAATTPTLGDLIDALDVNTEALLAVAKRAPKVRPNGTLASVVEQVREVQRGLASCERTKRRGKR